jgi:hypothetical protein
LTALSTGTLVYCYQRIDIPIIALPLLKMGIHATALKVINVNTLPAQFTFGNE